ncbi:MAG: TrbG/VirB9 family P-type conjugative transfer protein [Rhodobiaceae bacterium]|jgi:hypothetical protein|nr:TrbG/VirB9 family P-type conjugative transfer protein [Rhodobiaceae bacterium]
MSRTLALFVVIAVGGCAPERSPTEFRTYAPATQALPVGLSTTVPTPWTDFITPNVTFEVQPDQVYEIWVKPGEATILNFPNDEFITSKSVSDPAHFFLSQSQPNHYTPTDHRLAVLTTTPNKSAMLEVFTETRHYRVRLKSLEGPTFNRTVDWQLPRPEVQVASAAPFRPSDVPLARPTRRASDRPTSLAPSEVDLNETIGAVATADQSPKATPQTPEPTPASSLEWKVREGQTLTQVLTEWTVKAGYRLLPLPEQGWRLGVTDSFTGDFESALEWLFSGFAHADKRPVAVLHSNRVIEIKEQVD